MYRKTGCSSAAGNSAETGNEHITSVQRTAINELLVKLVKTQPIKSFLRLSFHQFINFILNGSKSALLEDVEYLLSFVDEIRTSYETLCWADRRSMALFWKTECKSPFDNLNGDASFLSNWFILEAAKYCICQKFAPDMSANEFLTLLQRETSSPVSLGKKLSRRFLVNFLHALEKYIFDRISESSTGKHTFSLSISIDKFYEANSSIFRSWLLKNRPGIARLSLTVDEPAECLRNISLKLCLDLDSISRGLSASPTFMSLNSQNWRSNLNLIAISAKELQDLPLLYGLQALVSSERMICDCPTVDAMISNLEGRYQATYDSLVNQPEEIKDQNLIEFLNSCIELGVLEENIHHCDRFNSSMKRDLYKNYSRSRARDGQTPLRIDELEQWLSSWSDINDFEQKSNSEVMPIKSCLDLIIPTCLNMISKEPQDARVLLVERAERLISQDLIAQCLFTPNIPNSNFKVFYALLRMLRGELTLSEELVNDHAKDLYWNHSLYRHLCDLNMIERLKSSPNSALDLIQYKAAKFNLENDNLILGTEIAKDLTKKASSVEVRLLSSLLLINNAAPTNDKSDTLFELAKRIKDSDAQGHIKDDLILKVVRRLVRVHDESGINKRSDGVLIPSPGVEDKLTLAVANIELPEGWRASIDSSNLIAKIRTYRLFSQQMHAQFESDLDSDQLLNMAFDLDLDLLALLSQSNNEKDKAHGIESASRTLSKILNHHKRLTAENLLKFSSDNFITMTMRVWIVLKSNLTVLVFNEGSLARDWKTALLKVLKTMGKSYPNLLIYSVITNRLDLQNEISRLSSDPESGEQQAEELCTMMLKTNVSKSDHEDNASRRRKLEESQHKIAIWNELLDHIKLASCPAKSNWLDIVEDTELFLKELRKISFLSGEYMRTLTTTIPKKLNGCLRYFLKFCDPQTGIILDKQRSETCEKRLKTDCDYAIKSVKNLLLYGNRTEKAGQTFYDVWFYQVFTKQLNELEYRLNLLTKKKPLVLNDLERLVKSITELLKMCRTTLMEYNRNNRQQLYMEMVSPLLSRLNLNNIPMPDCCDLQRYNRSQRIVTIDRVSQTVHLIHSKTCPKKMKFLGTDGVARSFLLKAHEDLRLDQFIMELFGSINQLLLSNGTQNTYRIRRYSVTPISSQSGLIQWIDAPSLCSFYRAWLNGPHGRKTIDDIYASTCQDLCDETERSLARPFHVNCLTPQDCQMVDAFYQLLWAKTRPVNHHISRVKPSVNNCLEYRALFDPALFQGIVEQLSERSPKELFSNQLWYKSNNAHSYWMKTRTFIDSCATMSIVGYIIGLGDRHLENMLLDCNSGEIIHIDYNICFELGKTLSIPEMVPFRLTQNMIHSFGFAGLNGGFRLSCRNVLNILRDRKSTLLHLLDKVNLSFLQIRGAKLAVDGDYNKQSSYLKQNPTTVPQPPIATERNRSERLHDELEMCSQESIELKPPINNVTDLLMMTHHSLPKKVESQTFDKIKPKPFSSASPAFDSQYNIKTSADLPMKVASGIQDRISDKLSGTDECLRHFKYNKQFCSVRQLPDASVKNRDPCADQNDQVGDLILLNDAQSVEEQVDALIAKASSIRNRAKMFEGWLPWV